MLGLAPVPDNDDGTHSPRRVVISNRVADSPDLDNFKEEITNVDII